MPANAALLSVKRLVKSFGGVRAVNDVSLDVHAGDILGLIGPNGAGKTTTFNLISGRLPPTSGEIALNGQTIRGLRPHRIVGLGIARTFQGTRIFPKLTVAENVETAILASRPIGFWADWLGLPAARAARAAAGRDIRAILACVGLQDLEDHAAGSLAYAHQNLLGIALALALTPKLLLLDEPFAGMNPSETMAAARMVRTIRDTGVTILLVEHDMPAVMNLCNRIVVLDQGAKIAEGSPTDIRNDPRVIEAYLGVDDDAA